MARIRTIKPAFFRHKGLFELERTSGLPIRVAFAGLWTVADREGRFRWVPDEVKLDCLPHDDVDFVAVLEALSRGGFIRAYDVGGKTYGLIVGWHEHQKVPNGEAQSALPAEPSDQLIAIDRNYHRGKEGKGKEVEGNGNGGSAEPPCDSTPTNGLRIRADDGECILTFPVVGTHGSEWRLRRRQVDEWGGLYPGLDVIAECRHALAWVQANPGRRKTPQGMPRFLTNWFNRTVERRPAAAVSSQTRHEPQTDWFEECQRLHGGLCNGQYAHGLQLRIDAKRGLPTGAI